MEDLKKKIEENLKKGFTAQKNYYLISDQLRSNVHKASYFWYDLKTAHPEDFEKNRGGYQEEYDALMKKNEKDQNKIEILKNIVAITQNNLKIYIVRILRDEVFEILKKYHNKNIGEKTKEKIEEEIKDYYKNNYNICLSVTLSNNIYFSEEKILTFSVGDAFKNYHNDYTGKDYRLLERTLGLQDNRSFTFTFYVKNSEADLSRYDSIEDFTEYEGKLYKSYAYYMENLIEVSVEDIDKTAKKIKKDREKALEKMEKLEKELQSVRNYFNNGIEQNNTTEFLRFNYIEK